MAESNSLNQPRLDFISSPRVESGVATDTWTVSSDEWYLAGHFPKHPIVPGVMYVEALSQLALHDQDGWRMGRLKHAKFRYAAQPGEEVHLTTTSQQMPDVISVRGKATVGDNLCCQMVADFVPVDSVQEIPSLVVEEDYVLPQESVSDVLPQSDPYLLISEMTHLIPNVSTVTHSRYGRKVRSSIPTGGSGLCVALILETMLQCAGCVVFSASDARDTIGIMSYIRDVHLGQAVPDDRDLLVEANQSHKGILVAGLVGIKVDVPIAIGEFGVALVPPGSVAIF